MNQRRPRPRARVNKRFMRAAIPLMIALIGIGSRVLGGGSVGSGGAARSDLPAHASSSQQNSSQQGSSQQGSSQRGSSVDRTIGFKSTSQLDSHYAKHGREFGSVSKPVYLLMAQQLRDAPLSSTVIEAWQARGNWARYNRTSGGFIAFRQDKVILTFFRPDDGEAYFRRASDRKP